MTNHFEIIFPLHDVERLKLVLAQELEHVICCERGAIVFEGSNFVYKFSISEVQAHMEDFGIQLKEALNNKLQLHESMTQDIGYLWNEAYRDKPGLVYEKSEEVPIWVGDKYRIWCAGKEGEPCFSLWMYNAADASIILEITPDYPWDFEGAEENSGYVSYDEWIKTYEPLVIRTIPKDIARQWLEQAEGIVRQIQENIER